MKQKYSIILAALVAFVLGCDSDESTFSVTPALGFIASSGSVLESNATGIRIGFYTNVAITEPVTVMVQVNNIDGLTYGVDFTTDPEPVDGIITVPVDPEDEQPSFWVIPAESADDTRSINFQIIEVSGNSISLGQPATLSYTLSITGFQPVNIFHDFNDCTTDFATPSGFREEFETTKVDRGWGCRAFGHNASRAPRASSFGGAAGEDRAWLIREQPFSVPSGGSVSIDFWTYSQYAGPGKVSVKWSSNYSGSGNPLAATWTTLTSLDSQFPAANSLTWTHVIGTFTDIAGADVYIAFVWTEGTAASSTAYDIDDLTIKVD